MPTTPSFSLSRSGALLAVNLLFLMVWGFAGTGKVLEGMPSWFDEKFGKTFLATFPGLTLTFWILALSEVVALLLAVVSLLRFEWLGGRQPAWLTAMLVWSLFVFLELGFGQWLTAEFNGAFQQFVYFTGTLVALRMVRKDQCSSQ